MRRFIIIVTVLVLLFSSSGLAVAQAAPLRVYYAGPVGSITTALSLSKDFLLVDQLDQADVIVLNGEIPQAVTVAARVRSGAGLFLIFGPQASSPDLQSILGTSVALSPSDTEVSLVQANGTVDPIVDEIIWSSAPQVKERVIPSNLSLEILVISYEDQGTILAQTQLGEGRTILFTPSLTEGTNQQFQQWAYFNYWIYSSVSLLGGRTPLSFGQYPASPVPHENERFQLLLVLAVILAGCCLAFWRVRKYSLSHPHELNALVVDRREYHTRQEETEWDRIGFHRPLGGFLLAFMMGVIVFIPLIIYQNMILPAFILPSAQALGIWGRVTQFFNLLWQVFDLGTAAAFVKYFAEFRVHDPRKAVQYGQLFIWWQLLSGAIQVAIVTLVASLFLPESPFALYAWSVIIHSFIQIPGFLGVMRLVLNSHQRADYGQIVTLATEVLLPILVQPIFVTLMVIWGKSNPIFGESMGGLLGLGIATYVVQLLAFFLGFWLFHRLGYNARILFMAHFDRQVIRSAFRFGIFEMLGASAWGIGQTMEIVVTQARLVNYAEIWGNWGLAQNFIFSFQIIGSLYDNLMPSISEAISNGKRLLSRYYSAMAYKWGGMISAYIGAILLAVADRFILGASGPTFSRAALYSIPLIIWGAIQYPSWVGDNVQLAANKPYIKTALIFGEQTIRIFLAFVLIEQFQVTGLIIAYFIGLLAKDITSYFINHRLCFPQNFFFWQSLAAPLLAGTVHYLLVRWITGMIWQGDQITSVVIFFLGILPSYPLFAFLYGLFGGWDDATLDELRLSVDLSSFMRPFARLFWSSTALGARLSPLHGRFPIQARREALEEARELMAERVLLA